MSTASARAATQFGLSLSGLHFIAADISNVAYLADAASHPRFTLASQAVGMTLLGLLAHLRHPAHVVVDTANCAFALVAPRLFGAATLSYTHYPTLSIDMARGVARGEIGVNNNSQSASSPLRTAIKLIYYAGFAVVYGIIGRLCIDVAVGNSTWTSAHLRRTWRRKITTIFPPCPVDDEMSDVTHDDSGVREDGLVISVAQFRPEKRHEDQLAVLRALRGDGVSARLVMVGGARDASDRARAAALANYAEETGLPVEVRVGVSRDELRELLAKADIGLHTMRDEHFGIGVVELMQAGPIVVAHRSGGVATDIVRDGDTGFLASDMDEFVRGVREVVDMDVRKREGMRRKARASVARFSERAFRATFGDALEAAVEVASR